MSSDIHQHSSGESVVVSPEARAAARRTVAGHARSAEDLELLIDVLGLWPEGEL